MFFLASVFVTFISSAVGYCSVCVCVCVYVCVCVCACARARARVCYGHACLSNCGAKSTVTMTNSAAARRDRSLRGFVSRPQLYSTGLFVGGVRRGFPLRQACWSRVKVYQSTNTAVFWSACSLSSPSSSSSFDLHLCYYRLLPRPHSSLAVWMGCALVAFLRAEACTSLFMRFRYACFACYLHRGRSVWRHAWTVVQCVILTAVLFLWTRIEQDEMFSCETLEENRCGFYASVSLQRYDSIVSICLSRGITASSVNICLSRGMAALSVNTWLFRGMSASSSIFISPDVCQHRLQYLSLQCMSASFVSICLSRGMSASFVNIYLSRGMSASSVSICLSRGISASSVNTCIARGMSASFVFLYSSLSLFLPPSPLSLLPLSFFLLSPQETCWIRFASDSAPARWIVGQNQAWWFYAQRLASGQDPFGQNVTRSSRTRSVPSRFCTVWSGPPLEEWNRIGCGKSDPAYTMRLDSGCTLDVTVLGGRNQNASGMFTGSLLSRSTSAAFGWMGNKSGQNHTRFCPHV